MSKTVMAVFLFGLTLFLTGFTSNSTAMTEKERWEKEFGDNFKLDPIDPPIILEHGGPDDGGYFYIDSDDGALNAPEFQWIDISSIGTAVPLEDDENRGPFPIGFDFAFYGEIFTEFYVCSNGFISFTNTVAPYNNLPIPDPRDPNNMISLFWDDLNPENGGQVYYYTDTTESKLIISYDGVPHYSNFGSLYFQVVLSAGDSSIVMNYLSMEDGGHGNNGATVGIENSDGSTGTQYLFNQYGIHDSLSVYYGFEAAYFGEHEVTPGQFIALPPYGVTGDSLRPRASFINQGTNVESFQVRLIIELGANQVYNQTAQVDGLDPGESIDMEFPQFTPVQGGLYELSAISELVGDENPANDTIRADYFVYNSVYLQRFELTNGAFAGDGDWQWGEPTSGPGGAHSGVKAWATVLNGPYGSYMLSHLLSPPVYISDNAFFLFWHWYDIETNWDGGNVKISTDAGATWNILVPSGGYDGIAHSSNPLSGEQIFTGHSHPYWGFETFDLSSYNGMTIVIRFDFGSDESVTFAGWYVDDFMIYGGSGAEPGYISGTVTELSSGDPIEGALVTAGGAADSTDMTGHYVLDLIEGTYDVTASALYYITQSAHNIEVVSGNTTQLNFAMTAPQIQVDTSPIQANIAPGDTAVFLRNVSNTGNGELNFNVAIDFGEGITAIRPRIKSIEPDHIIRGTKNLDSGVTDYSPTYAPAPPPVTLDLGDEIFRFDPETPTGDSRILGVEYDGIYFWVTGANDQIIKKLYKFGRDGNLLESFDQGTSSTWGWRDLAWDGQFLYGSDENELARIDPSTGQKVGELPMPISINPPMRALAWDPATDHFWAANFSSSIIEFDRQGNTLNIFDNTRSAYGLAWDNISVGGPYLWVYSQEGSPATEIAQFDPVAGEYTGIMFYAVDNSGNDALAGGLCFTTEYDPAFGIVACVLQDVTDAIAGYEITPAVQWLYVDPMSGVIGPGLNIDLEILIDFTGEITPDSTYNATVTILNNSPVYPEIPVTIQSQTGVEEEGSLLPRDVCLYQNFPNPFNPATDFKFGLPKQMDVRLEIFNILGQKTATVAEGLFPAGIHSITWDGGNFASGVYYYRLTTEDTTMIKKMTLIK